MGSCTPAALVVALAGILETSKEALVAALDTKGSCPSLRGGIRVAALNCIGSASRWYSSSLDSIRHLREDGSLHLDLQKFLDRGQRM